MYIERLSVPSYKSYKHLQNANRSTMRNLLHMKDLIINGGHLVASLLLLAFADWRPEMCDGDGLHFVNCWRSSCDWTNESNDGALL